jgi:hypothetical protein
MANEKEWEEIRVLIKQARKAEDLSEYLPAHRRIMEVLTDIKQSFQPIVIPKRGFFRRKR